MSQKVSVVIPAFNAAKTINAALQSVLSQSFTDYEVILVDDGSSDGTAMLVWSMHEQFIEQGVKLHIISQNNQGVSAARNRGVAEAVGKYIAFLDADDIWHKGKLSAHIKHLESDADIGLSFARVNYCKASGQKTGKASKAFKGTPKMTDFLGKNPTVSPSNWVLPQSVFNELSGFKSGMTHAEDQEFLIRLLADSDFKIDFLDKVLVDYHTSIDGLSADIDSMYEGWIDIAQCIEKYDSEFLNLNYKKAHAQYCFYLARRNAQVGGNALRGWIYFIKALSSDIKTSLFEPRETLSVAVRSIANSLPKNSSPRSARVLRINENKQSTNEGVHNV